MLTLNAWSLHIDNGMGDQSNYIEPTEREAYERLVRHCLPAGDRYRRDALKLASEDRYEELEDLLETVMDSRVSWSIESHNIEAKRFSPP